MSRYAPVPQQTADEEMYAAFENDDDDDDLVGHGSQSADSRPLLAGHAPSSPIEHPLADSPTANSANGFNTISPTTRSPLTRHSPARSISTPGTYDFEYDYASLPPPGSPPRPSALALPNTYGNSNGLLPSSPDVPHPAGPGMLRRALGAILPTHYAHDRRGGGLGNDGVFGNVVAKPNGPTNPGGAGGPEGAADSPYLVPEEAQKDAPPSYQAAQADSVPPYWENTILAPSGPMDGDMVIENLPVGSVFVFLWNLLVSVSFQFVGFLLTYLLHTTHAAKFGSRAGLGITLIQYGFYMRSPDAQGVPIASDDGWSEWPNGSSSEPVSSESGSSVASLIKRALPILYRAITVDESGTPTVPSPVGPHGPFSTAMQDTNPTGMAPPQANSSFNSFTPNDWLSFMLMTIGWFLLITSVLGFWRVKRWERGVQQSVSEREREFELRGTTGQRREPTPEELVRNAMVLRNLESVFGIALDENQRIQNERTGAPASAGVVASPSPPASAPADVERRTRRGSRRVFRMRF